MKCKKCRKCGARLSPFMRKSALDRGICENCESIEEVLKHNPHLCSTDF